VGGCTLPTVSNPREDFWLPWRSKLLVPAAKRKLMLALKGFLEGPRRVIKLKEVSSWE
jgi:hypothetical protein